MTKDTQVNYILVFFFFSSNVNYLALPLLSAGYVCVILVMYLAGHLSINTLHINTIATSDRQRCLPKRSP